MRESTRTKIFASSQSLIQLGRLLDTFAAATTVTGYTALPHWFSAIGLVIRIGVERTGSYGVAVTVHLRSQDFRGLRSLTGCAVV